MFKYYIKRKNLLKRNLKQGIMSQRKVCNILYSIVAKLFVYQEKNRVVLRKNIINTCNIRIKYATQLY